MNLSFKQRIGLELQRQLRHTQAQLHPLRTLFWECTLRCNLSCRHCGSDCKMVPEVPDMPADDFLHVLDTITPHVDPHHVFVIISGGEVLLRDDLEAVGREIYDRGFPWGIVTNGLILEKRRLQALVESGLHSITVSLDGLEDQHNWMRGNPQSFVRATQAIGLLSERRDILWDVVTCVSPNNYQLLHEMRELLVGLGVRDWRLFSIFPMGRAAEDPGLQLSDEQFRGLLDFIKKSREDDTRIHVSYACEGFLGPYEQKVRDQFFFCRSGVDVASIRCDGAIGGCTSVRSNMEQGNIYQDDFWDVWQNRFHAMRDRKWAHKEQCADCKMWRYCEGSSLHLYNDDQHLLDCQYQRLLGSR